MSDYISRPDDIRVDTQKYLKTDLGEMHMKTLNESIDGVLSRAATEGAANRDFLMGKYAALKEWKEFIKAPLDADNPLRG